MCERLCKLVAELIDVSEQVCQARVQAAWRDAVDESKKRMLGGSLRPVPNSTVCSVRT